MFEPEAERKKVERAMLVGIEFPDSPIDEAETLLKELRELVENLDIGVIDTQLVKLKGPKAKYLTGTGKASEIIERVHDLKCDCIVFDNELTPGQQRNWEKDSGVTVIDRQEVILDIFAERAQTKAAVLQVELARLQYSLPRLRRAWTHLQRQRGGSATQRGEGEQQLQLDQRIIRNQISKVRSELVAVIKQRDVQRRKRMNVPMPSAAIVGYTNAGKSSLLNRLTNAEVQAEDKLFATLDPTTRRHTLPNNEILLLTDTVGFVRRLPHGLVEAFKATLEEALVSDFLIHLLDASSPDVEKHMQTTRSVLEELGAEEKHTLIVFNKTDAVENPLNLRALESSYPEACFISVHDGSGIDTLEEAMQDALRQKRTNLTLLIPHDRYDLVSLLHREGAVRSEKADENGICLRCSLPVRMLEKYKPYEAK